MKKETKDKIVGIGAGILTVGTSSLLALTAEAGAVALVNHVFKDGLTKGQARFFGAIITVGGMGIGMRATDILFDRYIGQLEDLMDIFPTDPIDPKEVESDD